jgi:hypothetical protein
MVAPGVAGGWLLTAFGTSSNVAIDDANNVLWFGDWNDPDTTRDTGLFLNGELLVQEGVTMINGMLLTSINQIQDNLAISPNGQYIIFKGILDGSIDAAIIIQVPEPTGAVALTGVLGVTALRRRRA